MKRVLSGVVLTGFLVILSGCSFPGSSGKSGAAVLRSDDGGVNFVPKVTVNEKTTIASVEVLSLLFDPSKPNHVLLGTKDDGIFASENGGDAWRKLEYPPTKVYGLARDVFSSARLYATGEWQGRGKIYRSDDDGVKWKEIYTEPSNGTVITALIASTRSAGVVYAGTSAGVVIKTTDSGETWGNAASLDGPVLSLAFNSDSGTLYALASGKGIFRKTDSGDGFSMLDLSTKSSENEKNTRARILSKPVSIAADPSRSGVLYVGTEKDGLWMSADNGEHWSAVDIIASSAKFPIRAIAIRPGSSNEILYSSALAVYRSVDSGANWSVYQLDANRPAGLIRYDPSNSSRVFLGLRTF